MRGQFARQRGLTLIELMTAVLVAAILIALTIPSFRKQIETNTNKSVMAGFITGMAYARSESVKRGGDVHLRTVSANADWSQGWCVTTGNNCTANFIKKFEPTGAVKVTGEAAATSVFTFNAQGHLQSPSGHVSVCSGEEAKGQKVAVTLLGQALAQPCDCDEDGHCE